MCQETVKKDLVTEEVDIMEAFNSHPDIVDMKRKFSNESWT